MNLCEFKDMFGTPKKGIHSVRIYDIAIIDVILTVVCAYIISYLSGYSFGIILIILFLLSVIMHRLFCVRTTVDRLLFSN